MNNGSSTDVTKNVYSGKQDQIMKAITMRSVYHVSKKKLNQQLLTWQMGLLVSPTNHLDIHGVMTPG